MDYAVLQPWFRKTLSESVKAFAVVREGNIEHRKKSGKFWGALCQLGFQLVRAEAFAARQNLCRASAREVVDHVVGYLLAHASTDNLVYVGHDFYAAEPLISQRGRGARVFAAAFLEHLSSRVVDVVEDVFDLEQDIGAFRFPLPRLDIAV